MAADDLNRATPPLLKQAESSAPCSRRSVQSAPISRAEISRRVGISKPTVSLALRSLLHAGLVFGRRVAPTRPSCVAALLDPVPDAAFVLGIDLGTRFAARRGVRSPRRDSWHVSDVELRGPTPSASKVALETIAEAGPTLDERRRICGPRLDGVVVGVPGAVDARTGEISARGEHPRESGGRDLSATRSTSGSRRPSPGRQRHQPGRSR